MAPLYMLGTIHFDLKGPERLWRFLDLVKPETICIEASSNDLEEVKGHRAYLFREWDSIPEDLRRFLFGIEFEFWVPLEFQKSYPQTNILAVESQYARECFIHGIKPGEIPQSKLGLQNFEREYLEAVQALMKPYEQRIIDRIYEQPLFAQQLSKTASLDYREQRMEENIREAIERNPRATTVVINGIAHLFGNHRNLFERLRNLSPKRIKLLEVDNLDGVNLS